MARSRLAGIVLWAILFVPLQAALAQNGSGAASMPPSLACTHPVFGSDLKISLIDGPPGSLVIYYAAVKGFTVELGRGVTDSSGGDVFVYRLTSPDWVGEEASFWAEVRPPGGGAVESGRLDVRISNPGLFVPCVEPDGSGSIAFFDEVTGNVTARAQIGRGKPGKIFFNRDGSRGFVLLDTDQIGVFDPFEERWLFWFIPTDSNLVDIAATPDGSKIIVLCGGVEDPLGGRSGAGSLHVYDIDPRIEARAEPVMIDPVNPPGSGRILAVSEDSRLVYIRTGGSFIGEYNVETGAYKRIHLGDRLAPCTIKDIRLQGNILAALLTQPDGEGYICVFNTQTYARDYVPVGWNPLVFDLIGGEGAPMAVVLRRTRGEDADGLDVVDLAGGRIATSIFTSLRPAGIRDVDVAPARDVGVVLYVPGGVRGHKGYLGFFDSKTFSLRNECVLVPVDAGSRLFLSRSPVINRCYVLNRNGTLTVVDLDRFRKAEVFDLGAEFNSLPGEYH